MYICITQRPDLDWKFQKRGLWKACKTFLWHEQGSAPEKWHGEQLYIAVLDFVYILVKRFDKMVLVALLRDTLNDKIKLTTLMIIKTLPDDDRFHRCKCCLFAEHKTLQFPQNLRFPIFLDPMKKRWPRDQEHSGKSVSLPLSTNFSAYLEGVNQNSSNIQGNCTRHKFVLYGWSSTGITKCQVGSRFKTATWGVFRTILIYIYSKVTVQMLKK